MAQAVGVGTGGEGGGYVDPNDPSIVLVSAPMVSAEEGMERGREGEGVCGKGQRGRKGESL